MKKGKVHPLLITVIVYGLLYSLISLVNHFLFRTYALDLGLYSQALYQYAHLDLANSSMIKEGAEPLLGSHFDLYLPILSPLSYLFGTYTLLIVQIIAVLGGGIGVYRYFEVDGKRGRTPILATLFFYTFFGTFSALSFDYHSVVVASSLLPWFLLSIKQGKRTRSILLLLAILIAQENVALWIIFVCLGLAIEYRKKGQWKFLLGLAAGSAIYFVLVIKVLIPAFSNSGEYAGFLYSVLGNSPWEAIQTLITHPIDSIRLLFANHHGDPLFDGVKTEFHLFVLISGGYLLLFRPAYLLMLIPLYAQKLYHDQPAVWSFGGQYVIEFAPVLAIGIFNMLQDLRPGNLRKVLSVLVLLGVAGTSLRMMDNPLQYVDRARIRFYQATHYERQYNVKKVKAQLKQLPEDAAISALSPFVPHLSMRSELYQFPIIANADYIVYSTQERSYPLTKEQLLARIAELEGSTKWKIHFQEEGFTILKRQP